MTPLGAPILLAAALAAALISALATPVFARFAASRGIVAHPRGDRWHRRATPFLGGGAMALAVLVPYASLASDTNAAPMMTVLAGGIAAVALGLLDDIRHLAPTTKLVGQVLVASALVVGGVQVRIIDVAPISFLITVFWVVALMNAVNLLDNMDGLAAGITAIAAAFLGLTAVVQEGAVPGTALLAGITAGAALGFLTHNFAPARVFMGDAGSQLLGYLLAVIALMHTSSAVADITLALFVPVAILALPIFDTAFVTFSRRTAGLPISRGGRDHTSHRLAALGLSDRAAVVAMYAVAMMLAAAGVIADLVSTLVAPMFVIAVVALLLFGAFLQEVDVYGSDRPPQTPVAGAIGIYARFGVEVGLDLVLLTTAYYLSYIVRFEGLPIGIWMPLFTSSVPLVVGIQLVILVVFGVYRTLWRYLSVTDAVAIVRAVAVGTGLAALGLVLVFRFENYSRAVFLIDAVLGAGLIVAARAFGLWLRHTLPGRPTTDARRVLIAGAGDEGVLAMRLVSRAGRYRPIGFVDDDPGKRYRRVSGVPIVGTIAEIGDALERTKPDLVILTVPDDEAMVVRSACTDRGIPWREFLAPV